MYTKIFFYFQPNSLNFKFYSMLKNKNQNRNFFMRIFRKMLVFKTVKP